MLKKLLILTLLMSRAHGSQENHEHIITKSEKKKKTVTKNVLVIVTQIKPLQDLIQSYLSDWKEIERLKLLVEIESPDCSESAQQEIEAQLGRPLYNPEKQKSVDEYRRYQRLFGEVNFGSFYSSISNTTATQYPGRGFLSIFSPNRSLLAAFYESANILSITDILKRKTIKQLALNNSENVTSMSFTADNAFLAATLSLPDCRKCLRIWDLQTGTLIQNLTDGSFSQVRFAPDGLSLGFMGLMDKEKHNNEKRLVVIDPKTAQIKSIIVGYGGIAFSADNKYAVVARKDRSLNQYITLLQKTELEYEEPVLE